MIKRIGLLLLVTVNVMADNCYVFDRSNAIGERHYEECKDQAAQMEQSQARLDRWSDSINNRNAADQAQADQEQQAQQLNAILRQLQERNK